MTLSKKKKYTGKDYFEVGYRDMAKRIRSGEVKGTIAELNQIRDKLKQRAQQEGLLESPLDSMKQLDEFRDKLQQIIREGGLYEH